MKRGFTLIELLAVIVILAVIALIATPIIINIIEDSKKQSAIDSAQLYVDGLSKLIVSKNMTGNFIPSTCTVGDEVTCGSTIVEYPVSGKKPTSGYVNYSNGLVTDYTVCVMDYKVEKTSSRVTATKSSECNGGTLEPPEEILAWDGSSVSTELEGCGVENNEYLINSPADLIYIRNQVNNDGNITTTSTCSTSTAKASDAHYKQTVGIALNDTTNWASWDTTTTGLNSWTPVGLVNSGASNYKPFSGIYDGNNHSISGIYINTSDSYQGLFGYINNATIKNLKINKSFVSSQNGYVGLIAGYAGMFYGVSTTGTVTINNCSTEGKLSAAGYLGGAIGNAYVDAITISNTINKADITNSSSSSTGGVIGELQLNSDAATPSASITGVTNYGTVTAKQNVGGIIGFYNGPVVLTVSNSSNRATVGNTNSTYYAGGLIGATPAGVNMSNSYNTGNITGYYEIGGLIGYINSNNASTITNSYNTGTITGLQDDYNNIADYAGGIIAYAQNVSISQSYNIGNITGVYYAGGIMGYDSRNSSINESYNKGNITLSLSDHYSNGYLGGLVGSSSNGTQISNSYNTGNITTTRSYVGGIIGNGTAVITNAYNTGNISMQTDYPYAGGIKGGYGNGSVTNSYNTGNISYGITLQDTTYSNFEVAGIAQTISAVINTYNTGVLTQTTSLSDRDNFLAAGIATGEVTMSSGNQYLVGTAPAGIFYKEYNSETYEYERKTNGTGVTAISSINDMPTILSVVNGDNKFKADTNNINNGNPILSWQ